MAGVSPNLKVNVGADTSQFDKSMKAAKAEIRDFGKVSDNVLDSLGRAVGVDVKEIETMSNAIRGMGRQLSESGNEGAAGLAKILSSMSALRVGIAALGIAGVVASFKALNSEAEAFKSTVAGANLELQTAAFIEAYTQAFHDFNAETGQAVANFEEKWKRTFAVFAANFKQNVVGFLTGQQATPTASLPNMFISGNPQQMAFAASVGERARQITEELYKLDRQRSDLTREIADLDARIASNRAVMRDSTYSLTERLAAYDALVEDINTKERLLVPIEQQRTALMDEMVGLTQSSPAAVDAANEQYVRQQTLVKSIKDEKASLLRYVNSLRNQNEKNNEILQRQLELEKQIAQSRRDLGALDLSVNNIEGPGASVQVPVGLVPRQTPEDFQEIVRAQFGDTTMVIGVQLDKERFVELGREIEMLVGSLANNVGEAIGGLVGDLVSGGDAWGNFANAALSSFGDLAMSVGKMAIAVGVATLGIKAALESLNGWVAIAAGTALVALGAAVKSGLSNVAAGNYSASAAVASGNYSAGTTSEYETREINVKVTGTLEADGDKLKAVLNNTDNRNGYTT